MDSIVASEEILFVWSASTSDKVEEVVNKIKEHSGKAPNVENLERLQLGKDFSINLHLVSVLIALFVLVANLPKSHYDKVIVTTFGDGYDEILKVILASLKPNGKTIFLETSTESNPLEQLKLSGFQNPAKTSQNGWTT